MTEDTTTSPEEEKKEEATESDNVGTSHGASMEEEKVEEKPDDKKKKEEKKEEVIEEMTTLHERTIATLSYIGFFAIVPFYLKKDSKFCRFHGKQGMLVAIIFFSLSLFKVLGLIMDLVLILQFVIFLWMGFSALSGKWKKLPFIYDASCKLEEALKLKTKEEEVEDEALKAGDIKPEEEVPVPAECGKSTESDNVGTSHGASEEEKKVDEPTEDKKADEQK